MIIDFLGPINHFDLHPTELMVAYDQGNNLLLWDLTLDKKLRIHTHDTEINAVLFCDHHLVASISAGTKSQLFITEWQSLNRLHSIYLPSKHRSSPLHSVRLLCHQSTIFILEQEQQQGYRLSVWKIKLDQLILQYITQLDPSAICSHFLHFPSL